MLPANSRDISGCHLSSFLCLSEDYQVAMQAGTALGEAGEARWDTSQLHRGDMLLMVATSRHHGLPTPPDSKDGLHGALFNLWTPDRAHKHHKPNTTDLDLARSEAGADRERKVGWKGQVGGPAGTDSGGSAKRAWVASPSHNPTLPTAPFPTHNTWSTLGKSQLDNSQATSRASLGEGSSRSASSACCSSWAACTS